MKKSLIALAALGAFAGAASAQSSVTLYGLVDLSYQNIKAGDLTATPGATVNKLADGTEWGPGSRWGLRVSEDLGSGLKANVVLESGFGADTGASQQSNRLFGRQAFVSLASSSLGEVRLGRQYTLNDEAVVLNNPFGNTMFLHTGVAYSIGAAKTAMFLDTPRVDNAVHYISPSFGGFRVQGMVSAGEGANDRYQGVKAAYANGPLNVALAYEVSKDNVGARENVNKITTLGANYDFGMFRLFGGFQDGRDLQADASLNQTFFTSAGVISGTINKLRAYTVGASMPFGAITVGANYVRTKYDTNTGADYTLGRAAVGATYSLSKLTTLFTAFEVANGDLKDRVSEKRGFEIGLRKAF